MKVRYHALVTGNTVFMPDKKLVGEVSWCANFLPKTSLGSWFTLNCEPMLKYTNGYNKKQDNFLYYCQ